MGSPEQLKPIQSYAEFLPIIASGQYHDLKFEELEQIVLWGLDKYNLRDFQKYLTQIAKEFGGDWEVFKGLKCLDICCGGWGPKSESFYPWLPAILGTLGAEVTGLDIGTQPEALKDVYQHIRFNLLDLDYQGLNKIPEIGNKKYNLITFLNTINPYVPSDVLTKMAYHQGLDLRIIQNRVLANIDNLLEPNGMLYMDTLDGWQQITRKKRL